MLAQAILLSPLGDQAADEDLRRELLPDIEHVRKCQKAIREQISKNQELKRLPALRPTLTSREVLQLAKYSRVYSQCGLYNEAENLLVRVRDFVSSKHGAAHPVTVRVQLALSQIYLGRRRAPEAEKLLNDVLDICTEFHGKDAHLSLTVMDELGVNQRTHGHLLAAQRCHQIAKDEMSRTLGPDHEDTLKATVRLGKVHHQSRRYHEAKELHSATLEGMKKNERLSLDHHETLDAQESLALDCLLVGGGSNLEYAHQLLTDALERRTKKLGKEHQHTLVMKLNYLRVRSAQGFHEEAEQEMRAGLAIATRNLGANYIGTLYGASRFGLLLICRNRFTEAEDFLQKTIKLWDNVPDSRGGAHPTLLTTMYYLSHSYRLQEKYDEALELCFQIRHKLESIDGREHPFWAELEQMIEALKDPADRGSCLSDEWKIR